MKKILAIVPAIALALGASSSLAFAHSNTPTPTLTIGNTNYAEVANNVGSTSKTGGNSITAPVMVQQPSRQQRNPGVVPVSGSIYTGTATTKAMTGTLANTNHNSVPALTTGSTSITSSNTGFVTNNVGSTAATGKNSIVGSGTISTGAANSTSASITIINSSVNKIN